MPVIRVYTGPSTYKELDLDDYYVRLSDVPDTTDFINALRTPTVYMRDLRLYQNGVPTSTFETPSIVEMAMIPERFSNKLAFYDISKIKFYTSNDKITWTEFVVSDDNKRKLVGGDTPSTAPLRIPAGTPHFRIEIEAAPSYCFLNALYSYWNSQGNRVKVKIQKRNCSTLAWKQHTDSDVYVSAAPGHLFLPFESIWFHPSSTSSADYNAIRIDIVDIDWRYPENEIRFFCLQIWGAYPAGKRTIYSVDEYKKTTFPAEVKATTFKRSSDNVEVSYKDHNHLLSDLSDVTFTNLHGGQMMIYTPEGGGKWVNFTPDFASRIHTHSADDINSGTLDSARIPNLSASKITSGILSTDVLPNIPFDKITTLGGNDFLMSTPDGGLTFVSLVPFDRLPTGSGSNEVAIGNHKHSASEITSGTLDSARIPNLSASKITSGTLDSARIPNLSASKITSGTLSSDRLPSIPFNLLPVGTSPNTVAQGTHTHGIGDIFDYVDRGLQLLRTKPSSLTSVGSGTTSGSVTLNSTLFSGSPIFIEVNTSSSYTAVPKIIGVTVGGTTAQASATGEEYIAGWSTFDGTDFHIYTFSVWYSDDTLYFGAKRYIRGNFTSSAINWTTSTYTLYVGRVWKLPIN